MTKESMSTEYGLSIVLELHEDHF